MRHYCDLKGGNWWFALFLWCSCVSYYSETLSFISLLLWRKTALGIFESKHNIISLALANFEDISRYQFERDPRRKRHQSKNLFRAHHSFARLVSFYSPLCASRERQRRSILAFSLVFFVRFGKNAFTGGGEFPYLKTSNTTRAYITIGIAYAHIFERRRQTIWEW